MLAAVVAATPVSVAFNDAARPGPVSHTSPAAPDSDSNCTTLISAWNSLMTSFGTGTVRPTGWSPASVPAEFPVPVSDGHAKTVVSCGASDSSGDSTVLTDYAIDGSGDWDTAYYYAIRFEGWAGPDAGSPSAEGS